MKKQTRILVTGAGALLGQGILRCLNASNNNYFIVTADPENKSTGHALGHIALKIPLAKDPRYISAIEKIIGEENIDIVLIGTDVELPVFSQEQQRLEAKFNVKIVVSTQHVIEIANDKYLTAKFLEENGFPFPQSALTTSSEEISQIKALDLYPYIAKPVDGARSMGLEIIRNEADMDRITSYPNNLVVQEMISDIEGEYTTGCTVLNGKCVAVVSLTRELRDGNTWRAFRTGHSIYDNSIATIAESLQCEGPVNFQYRIRNGKPVIFEINCRFSGTTPLRMIYGYNEVEAVVEYYANGKNVEKPTLKTGTILRTFSDIFIDDDQLSTFEEAGRIENLEAKYIPFKN